MPTVGWLTYLSKQDFPELPTDGFPAAVKVDHSPHGTYVSLGEDPLHVSEGDAVTLYRLLERPFHAHPFTGIDKDKSFNLAAYRARVTGIPDGVDYEVNGYRFDGYRAGKLLYAHDQYQFDAANVQLKPTQIRDEFLPQAKAQLQAAQGYPVIWFFPQRQLALAVEAMLAHEHIGDIYVRYVG